MAEQEVLRAGREALLLVLVLSAPALAVSLVVGVAASLAQAMTHVQEPTLAFVPKLVAVFLVLAVAGPWMGGEIVHYTASLWSRIPALFP